MFAPAHEINGLYRCSLYGWIVDSVRDGLTSVIPFRSLLQYQKRSKMPGIFLFSLYTVMAKQTMNGKSYYLLFHFLKQFASNYK